MKVYIKLFFKSASLTVVAAVLGLLLLIGIFSIPTRTMEQNLIASIETFEKEGKYPQLNMIADSRLDNYTDAIILMSSAYESDSNVLDKAISVYRPGSNDKDTVEAMLSYYRDNKEIKITSYGRYWHGYLLFTKLLLSLFDYGEIRLINAFFVVVLAVALIAVMYYKKLGRYIIPYLIALLVIDPFAVSQSIQYVIIYYIYTIASIIFLLKKDYLCSSVDKFGLFFVIVGCCTSYFDLLTYPLATLGIPMILFVCSMEKISKYNIKLLATGIVLWFVGYAGMWACKWILGSVLGSENIILDAFKKLTVYTATDSNTLDFTVFDTIKRNLSYLFTASMLIAVIYVVIMGTLFCIRSPKLKLADKTWIIYIILCFIPIIWFLIVSRHSYIHSWFTYRELIIAVFSVLCLSTKLSLKVKGHSNLITNKSD